MKILTRAIIIFLIFLSPLLIAGEAKSYTFNPISGTYGAIYKNINILATPPTEGANAVKIHIKVDNARVNYYTPPRGNGWLAPIGECAGQKRYTANEICFSIAKSADIVQGESLGVINLQFTNYGAVSLTSQTTAFYTDGENNYDISGAPANFTINENGGNDGDVSPSITIQPTSPAATVTPTTSNQEPTVVPTDVAPTDSQPTPTSSDPVTPTRDQVVVPTSGGSNQGGQSAADSDTGTSLLLLFVGGLIFIGALFGLALLLIRRSNNSEDFGPTYEEINVNTASGSNQYSNEEDPYSITF